MQGLLKYVYSPCMISFNICCDPLGCSSDIDGYEIDLLVSYNELCPVVLAYFEMPEIACLLVICRSSQHGRLWNRSFPREQEGLWLSHAGLLRQVLCVENVNIGNIICGAHATLCSTRPCECVIGCLILRLQSCMLSELSNDCTS